MTTPDASELVEKIAAVNHPLRRRLIELIALEGPATASVLADRTGQHVGNVSHHLKMLARAGMVEEAPELAKDRRERWWRAVPVSLSWSVADVAGDPVGESVAIAAEEQNLAHHVGKVRDWYMSRDIADEPWIRAAFATEAWVAVTAEELAELGDRINALLVEFRGTHEQIGEGRRHCLVFAHGVPGQP